MILSTLVTALLIAGELAISEPIPVEPGSSKRADTTQCGGSPETLLGSRIIVRMEAEATPGLLRQARAGEIGGVILFPPPEADQETLRGEIERLQRAAAEASESPLLVAIDQEGGEVKRLSDAPPDLPPPEISAAGAPTARQQGAATARHLARLGVNADLAPVLDVPAQSDSFIAARAFGSDPATVAEVGTAFAEGLDDGGVAAAAKHFPGLGRSSVNTDLSASEVPAAEAELRADLEPFEAAIDAGVPLVMLANATYPALDPDLPAFASPAIAQGLLRDELGFDGVTITDDLGAGAVTASFAPAEAALAAARGGSDLLLFALTESPDVLDPLVRAAERGELGPRALGEACARVLELRERLAG